MRGKGLGLVCQFLKALLDRDVAVLTDHDVGKLAVENERVTGVVMRSGEFIAARKGVILATGGYGANPQMSWQFEQLPGFAHEASGLTPASLTGDGLVLGAEIGGILHRIENSLRVMLSYTIPPELPGGTPTCVYAGIVELCSPHTLLVNKYGRRFADETFFQGIVPQLRLFDPGRHEYPNLPTYLKAELHAMLPSAHRVEMGAASYPQIMSRSLSSTPNLERRSSTALRLSESRQGRREI